MGRIMIMKPTVRFHMMDGETKADAEDRFIAALDDVGVAMISWSDLDTEIDDTTEPAPVIAGLRRTGRWIEERGGCECSECGSVYEAPANYCPACGAVMIRSGGDD